MKITVAKKDDLKQLQALYQILFSDMHRLQPFYYQNGEQNPEFILSMIKGKRSDFLLAERESKLLGFALVQEVETPSFDCVLPHRYAYLMDLVVHPQFRSHGIGTLLLNAVKDWARQRRLEYVELTVLQENAGAIRLYERESFQETMKTMRFIL